MVRKLLLLLVLIAPATFAQEAPPADDPAAQVAKRLSAMSERLDLSDEQQSELREILVAGAERQRAIMESHGITPESRAAGERPGRSEMRALRKDMKAARDATDEKVAAVLNDDQMSEYRVMREEMQKQMRERMKEQQ